MGLADEAAPQQAVARRRPFVRPSVAGHAVPVHQRQGCNLCHYATPPARANGVSYASCVEPLGGEGRGGETLTAGFPFSSIRSYVSGQYYCKPGGGPTAEPYP
jgi:hypothetical protein